jgi:DNA-binding response OmpR family regulator
MNNLPSEINEGTIDIFVLSVSETVIPLLTENLEKKGYQVTRFTDSRFLLETLGTKKPNLLICDATTSGKDAYTICRQIKSDPDLWVIPVLILSTTSMLSDLFPILDCNADNFLSIPLDLPFSLTVIESMLGTPVEQQIPDQDKTQFKIRHDDRIYVIAANRRKLLELLLSSFEIAVNNSSGLSHAKTEIQALSESAVYLEERVTEQTRLIDTIKASLHQKEQKISTLTYEIEEKKKLLAQKDRKTVIITTDDTSHTQFREKKDNWTSSYSDVNSLNQQISDLSHEVETTKTSLDTVLEELEEEKMHCTSLECTLDLLNQQKELTETSLRSLSDEHEQLKSAFECERNRVLSAEQELTLMIQAKKQSEEELTLIINDFNETKNHQVADLNRLNDELEMEINRRTSAENLVGTLQQEKEQSESVLRSSVTTLKDQLDDLRLQLETTRIALENEENTTKVLKDNLAEIVDEQEKTKLRVQEDLETDKATLIKQNRDLEEKTTLLKTLEKNLNSVKIRNKVLVDELNLVHRRMPQSDQQVHLLSDELKKVQRALDAERALNQAGNKSIETLMETLRRMEQDLHISVEERNTLNDLLGQERIMRVPAEVISNVAVEHQDHPEPELRAVADEQVHIQQQSFPVEETAGIEEEKCLDIIVKAPDLPVIVESSSQVPAVIITPDIQKSPGSEHEPIPSESFAPVSEVSQKAVTDIIDIFTSDYTIEEDNLS